MPQPPDPAGMHHCAPILSVRDCAASLAYYHDRLGFTIDWEWCPDAQKFEGSRSTSFASVCRGKVNLFLCQGGQGQPGTWVYVTLDDVAALHDELLRRGATIVEPPTDKPWGMREMLVGDPDGHRIRFGAEVKR